MTSQITSTTFQELVQQVKKLPLIEDEQEFIKEATTYQQISDNINTLLINDAHSTSEKEFDQFLDYLWAKTALDFQVAESLLRVATNAVQLEDIDESRGDENNLFEHPYEVEDLLRILTEAYSVPDYNNRREFSSVLEAKKALEEDVDQMIAEVKDKTSNCISNLIKAGNDEIITLSESIQKLSDIATKIIGNGCDLLGLEIGEAKLKNKLQPLQWLQNKLLSLDDVKKEAKNIIEKSVPQAGVSYSSATLQDLETADDKLRELIAKYQGHIKTLRFIRIGAITASVTGLFLQPLLIGGFSLQALYTIQVWSISSDFLDIPSKEAGKVFGLLGILKTELHYEEL